MSIYESLVRGLNEAIEYERGTISLRSNTLIISDPEEFNANDIKNIRTETGLSQAVFAAAMGVSKKTVEAWEAGRNTPSGTAKRLLAIVEENPKFFETEGIVDYNCQKNEENKVEVTVRTKKEDEIDNSQGIVFSMYGWARQPVGGFAYGTSC